ncbi:MAG: hypothetical protein WBO93_01085, partial [Gammaproteobacteria bacterium]
MPFRSLIDLISAIATSKIHWQSAVLRQTKYLYLPNNVSLARYIHFHMLFLDGVYVERLNGAIRFRWVRAPTREELTQLAHTIA